jgi:hypothetical protein
MNAIIRNGRAHASDFLPQAKARRAGSDEPEAGLDRVEVKILAGTFFTTDS